MDFSESWVPDKWNHERYPIHSLVVANHFLIGEPSRFHDVCLLTALMNDLWVEHGGRTQAQKKHQ